MISSFNISAQNDIPVKWSFKVQQVEGDIYEIHATAKMDENWVIYSQTTDPDGPIPTEFEFRGIELIGPVKELSEKISKFSDLFEVEVVKFKDTAKFVQQFKKSANSKMLSGTVTFMTCDSKKCLPPTDVVFDLRL